MLQVIRPGWMELKGGKKAWISGRCPNNHFWVGYLDGALMQWNAHGTHCSAQHHLDIIGPWDYPESIQWNTHKFSEKHAKQFDPFHPVEDFIGHPVTIKISAGPQ